ncbi:MAG TPA: transcription antitermination factor NusB, partial [Gemmatimonadales bacterium]|nr:transcription antitermination factor NusB [Gemmatimonadales bacterium]
MIDARRAAWQLLHAVGGGQLFEAARDRAVSGLSERDRRLAEEIAAGVLRRRRTLDREIKNVLGKRWATTEPEIRDLLRVGLYQLRHLERVPPYAAVQSTVEAAKPLGRKRAAFVNAVLRRVAGGRADGRSGGPH